MTKLTIELVPKTAWLKNIRSELKKSEWDTIRRSVYEKAGFRCEVCGGQGKSHSLECHEIWDYDDGNKVQKLIGLIALCTKCHEVKHIGLASVRGNYKRARKHLSEVNGWSEEDAEIYIQHQFEIWSQRSNFNWKLDLSWLDKNKKEEQENDSCN